ncbi:ubiquitin carboxyl-terminal hydrolase 10 [Centruroides vittatus]|uniref:ubiquitin carboxyl-terminal hydrolase 10 n=1 Tax=Centruroides vittatus TaxID=120091 RepID=UPI00350F0147
MAGGIVDLKFLDETDLSSEEQKTIEDILNPANSASGVELPWDFLSSRNVVLESTVATVASYSNAQQFTYTIPSQHAPLSISPHADLTVPPRNINAETGVPVPIASCVPPYTGHPPCVISSTVPYPYPYQVEVPITPCTVTLSTRPDIVTIQQMQPHVTYASPISSDQGNAVKPVIQRSEEISVTSNKISNSITNNITSEIRTNINAPQKDGVLPAESVSSVAANSDSQQLTQAVPSSVPFMCGDTVPMPGPGPNFPRMPSFPYQPASPQVAFYAPIYNLPYHGCIAPSTSTVPNTTTMATVTNNEWVNNTPNVLPVFAVPNITSSGVNNNWVNNEHNSLPVAGCNNDHINFLPVPAHFEQINNPCDISKNEEKIDNTEESKSIDLICEKKNMQSHSILSNGENIPNELETTEKKNTDEKNDVNCNADDSTSDEHTIKTDTKPLLDNNTNNNSAVEKPKFMWSDLFKKEKSNQGNSRQVILSPITSEIIKENTSPITKISEVSCAASLNEDEMVGVLGKLLQEVKLDHTAPSLKPRGLVNRRNWCYINATLQALLACPPFYNLLKSFPANMDKEKRKSCTPIMDSLVKFVHEFPHMQIVTSTSKDDFPVGSAFEPIYIYKMLSVIKSVCVKGQQEDAEEFLSCILNGLHEEMLSVMKSLQNHNTHACNGNITINGHLDENEEEAWQLIGPKNKSMVTRTASISQSPISDIFGGKIRSILTAGNEHSAFIQPFFTLQLDIQAEKVDSVSGALSQLTAKEPIQGYTCAKTKQEVEAYKSILLEKLPPIFILHFKRFVYDKDGGCKKVIKKTDYPVELELGKEFLSHEMKRLKHLHVYKLIAVVYHDGEEAVKGHYIADVYHCNSDTWLRCDDRNISVISEAQVLRHSPPRVPYLLFYRNVETIRGSSQTK